MNQGNSSDFSTCKQRVKNYPLLYDVGRKRKNLQLTSLREIDDSGEYSTMVETDHRT